jgi:hypothetical protein
MQRIANPSSCERDAQVRVLYSPPLNNLLLLQWVIFLALCFLRSKKNNIDLNLIGYLDITDVKTSM